MVLGVTAATLGNLAYAVPQLQSAVAEAGCIPVLLQLLCRRRSRGALLDTLAVVLHILAYKSPSNSEAIATASGISNLVRLLCSSSAERCSSEQLKRCSAWR